MAAVPGDLYNLQVAHRPGYQHRNADVLSRKPCRSNQQEENTSLHDDLTNEQVSPDDLPPENEEDYACERFEKYPVRAITR
jgi:hypothetical protein